MSKRDKKIKKQELLATQQREQLINDKLKFSKKRFKKFDEVILRLYFGEDLSSFFTDRRIAKVNECFQIFSSKAGAVERATMKNVFVHLHRHSQLFSDEEYIQAVFNMFKFKAWWRKDVFEWKASSKRGAEQVNELADFLFCQYSMPRFMYKAFFERSNMLFINWFIHIGAGQRVKELMNVPIPFTQKMGHYFLQAPGKLSIAEALRWAQVKGLSGSDELAERIAYSWIGTKEYHDEEFWGSFIRIVADGGMFDLAHLTQLIDYVREMKRINRNYILKGRTLQSLIRQSEEWHERSIEIKGMRFWTSSGLYGYKAEKKMEIVKMEELTGSKLLLEEGRNMKHCVATYAHQCVTGKTAIFSLRKYSFELLIERMATIEVNLSLKRVVQAKAKMNKKISDDARKHLYEYAHKNELSVNSYL